MYIQTPHFTLERDKMGKLTLRDRATGHAHTLAPLDAMLLESDLEHCPARYFDNVLAATLAGFEGRQS